MRFRGLGAYLLANCIPNQLTKHKYGASKMVIIELQCWAQIKQHHWKAYPPCLIVLLERGGSVQSTPHGWTTLIEIYISQIYTKFNLQYHNLHNIWSYYKWIYCYLNLQYFNLQLKLIYTIFWSTCHQIYKSFLLCRN